jgi:glucose/arabinose dehydrogenase
MRRSALAFSSVSLVLLVAAACGGGEVDVGAVTIGAGGSSAGASGGSSVGGKGGIGGAAAGAGGTAGCPGSTPPGCGASAGVGGTTGGSAGTAGTAGGGGAAAGAAGASAGAAGVGGGLGGAAGTAGACGVAGGSAGSAGSSLGKSGKKFCDLPGPATALQVPPGFCIRQFADSSTVKEPRVIRIAPNGDVFVASPKQSTPGGAFGGMGAIVVLPDDDHDGRVDGAPTVFAGGTTMSGACNSKPTDPEDLFCVHGLGIFDGYVYFTRFGDLRRYPYAAGQRKAQGPSELVATLGMEQPLDWRFTHTVDRMPNGDVLVTRGRFDAADCSTNSMGEGAVFSVPVSGCLPAPINQIAQGFRNPMYARCHPTNGNCFANELSGDGWDFLKGREKLVTLVPGTNWGYPCCVDTNMPTNGGTADLCATVGTSTIAIKLHDTPFGLDFDRGNFPPPYKNGLFIANHGQVGAPWPGTQVVWYATDASGNPIPSPNPDDAPTPFVTGFGFGKGTVNGRATDVTFSPDGRMFILDDTSSEVWWVAPEDLESPAGW